MHPRRRAHSRGAAGADELSAVLPPGLASPFWSLQEILEKVAEAKGGGATAASLSPSDTLLQALGEGPSSVNAPEFLKARATISDLVVSYALHVDGRAMCCAAAASSE